MHIDMFKNHACLLTGWPAWSQTLKKQSTNQAPCGIGVSARRTVGKLGSATKLATPRPSTLVTHPRSNEPNAPEDQSRLPWSPGNRLRRRDGAHAVSSETDKAVLFHFVLVCVVGFGCGCWVLFWFGFDLFLGVVFYFDLVLVWLVWLCFGLAWFGLALVGWHWLALIGIGWLSLALVCFGLL